MTERKIKIFDTTLRDGEQTPGAHLSVNHKLEIALALERLGVDVIEVGFPASSHADERAAAMISQRVKKSAVCGLARAVKNDIDIAWNAIKSAANPRIHVFIATSPLHREHKLHMTKEDVLRRIDESVSYARSLCCDIQFSAEDATRTEPEFLAEAVRHAIAAGASTINIPDTVGYTTPEEFTNLISYIRASVPETDSVALSVHCHDDLGLAVANSLAAVRAGATQVECTVNGIGERAGNAAAEEIIMALTVRNDTFSVTHGITTEEIMRVSRLVASLSGLRIPNGKSIVGKNAFLHESGIHQHGVITNAATYEIMTPESIGLPRHDTDRLMLGKLSGRHAFSARVAELGYNLAEEAINTTFATFKEIAERKDVMTDSDVMAIINEYLDTVSGRFALDTFQIQSGNRMQAMAMITLVREDGARFSEAALGDGPVDAAFNAINTITGAWDHVTLETYNITAVTEGADALGEVRVKIKSGDIALAGRSVSSDIIKASIRAYLHAINKWLKLSET